MFGLLVKLSAGSWKNTNPRRNIVPHLAQQQTTPTQASINVATAIADISISGFSSSLLIPSPSSGDLSLSPASASSAKTGFEFFDIAKLNPKFRLTFYICSIGFTSSVLFDEQKRPYHLMLQRFDQLGGLKALFDAFHWSLSLLTDTSGEGAAPSLDRDKLQEGTLEFIEAWLQLVQKLVNTKNMLETRHSLNPNSAAASLSSSAWSGANTANSAAEIKKVCSFDPVKFLFKVHKESFEALMRLWSDDSKSFIIRENYSLSETVLNILCQILVGDSQLQKKLAEQKASSGTSTAVATAPATGNTLARAFLFNENRSGGGEWRSAASSAQPAVAQASLPVPVERQLSAADNEIINQMVAMGFSAELAREAVLRSPSVVSLEQAVEYCFNYTPSANVNTQATTTAASTTGSSSGSMSQELALPVIETAGDAATTTTSIALETTATSSSAEATKPAAILPPLPPPPPMSSQSSASVENELYQLDKAILDKFAHTMLPGLMKILDNVPDTIYRVCDLIVVVVKKYGDEWRDQCLEYILEETCTMINQVIDFIFSCFEYFFK